MIGFAIFLAIGAELLLGDAAAAAERGGECGGPLWVLVAIPG